MEVVLYWCEQTDMNEVLDSLTQAGEVTSRSLLFRIIVLNKESSKLLVIFIEFSKL